MALARTQSRIVEILVLIGPEITQIVIRRDVIRVGFQDELQLLLGLGLPVRERVNVGEQITQSASFLCGQRHVAHSTV